MAAEQGSNSQRAVTQTENQQVAVSTDEEDDKDSLEDEIELKKRIDQSNNEQKTKKHRPVRRKKRTVSRPVGGKQQTAAESLLQQQTQSSAPSSELAEAPPVEAQPQPSEPPPPQLPHPPAPTPPPVIQQREKRPPRKVLATSVYKRLPNTDAESASPQQPQQPQATPQAPPPPVPLKRSQSAFAGAAGSHQQQQNRRRRDSRQIGPAGHEVETLLSESTRSDPDTAHVSLTRNLYRLEPTPPAALTEQRQRDLLGIRNLQPPLGDSNSRRSSVASLNREPSAVQHVQSQQQKPDKHQLQKTGGPSSRSKTSKPAATRVKIQQKQPQPQAVAPSELVNRLADAVKEENNLEDAETNERSTTAPECPSKPELPETNNDEQEAETLVAENTAPTPKKPKSSRGKKSRRKKSAKVEDATDQEGGEDNGGGTGGSKPAKSKKKKRSGKSGGGGGGKSGMDRPFSAPVMGSGKLVYNRQPVIINTRKHFSEIETDGLKECRTIYEKFCSYGLTIDMDKLKRALLPPNEYRQCRYVLDDQRLPSSTSSNLLSHPSEWLPKEFARLEAANRAVERIKVAELTRSGAEIVSRPSTAKGDIYTAFQRTNSRGSLTGQQQQQQQQATVPPGGRRSGSARPRLARMGSNFSVQSVGSSASMDNIPTTTGGSGGMGGAAGQSVGIGVSAGGDLTEIDRIDELPETGTDDDGVAVGESATTATILMMKKLAAEGAGGGSRVSSDDEDETDEEPEEASDDQEEEDDSKTEKSKTQQKPSRVSASAVPSAPSAAPYWEVAGDLLTQPPMMPSAPSPDVYEAFQRSKRQHHGN